MKKELEQLLRRVVDKNSNVDIPALTDRIIALVNFEVEVVEPMDDFNYVGSRHHY